MSLLFPVFYESIQGTYSVRSTHVHKTGVDVVSPSGVIIGIQDNTAIVVCQIGKVQLGQGIIFEKSRKF